MSKGAGAVNWVWTVAYFPEIGHASVGRYRNPKKAIRAELIARGAPARLDWAAGGRTKVAYAETCDELIGKLPDYFPPGVNVQSMDCDTKRELDPLTDQPTDRLIS